MLRLRRLAARLFAMSLALGATAIAGAQGLTSAWDYDSDPFGAGRQVFSISTFNVGTDGSVAFTLTVDDGSLSNIEYKLFWLSASGDLLWSSDYMSGTVQALAIRSGHLMYLEGGQRLHSVKRNPSQVFEDTTVAVFTSSDTTYSIEAGRSPGFLYIAETASDKASFAIHAYRIAPTTTVGLVGMTAGVDDGSFEILFPSASGELYQIEKSDDLINWETVGDPIPGSGSLQSYSDPSAGTAAYYRVRRL